MALDPAIIERVCAAARQAMLLQTSADILEWDERTGMPIAAGEYRAAQVSTLRAMAHRARTDQAYGDDLQSLRQQIEQEDPHSPTAATVAGLYRDWNRDRKLPSELVQRASEATVLGQQKWDAAKKANDYSLFRETLDQILRIKREIGQRLREGTDRTTYEALMDEYEPDARVTELQSIFESLRVPLVDLVRKIREAPRKPDPRVLRRETSIPQQRTFNRMVAAAIGFDFDRGRLDETSHPFCTTLGPADCRILTRYNATQFASGLFGTLHEAGHGMYEQGLPSSWFGLPPGTCASLGIHESQSRLWENQVGRSRAFWKWLLPQTQQHLGSSLAGVDLDTLYFAVNEVEPSLIRVEADETTYNLHILIRFDLERQLIEDTLSVEDLPDAWNGRYESDLGVRPPSDASGVLQDVHWSAGLIGYFPTYTLGNLASAQLFHAASEQLGDLDAQFEAGEFGPLRQWLRENIHIHGRCYSGGQLVERACGSPLTADHLLRYLRSKLYPLYGIS
jgi:carboxypeptidase Taq